MHNKPDVREFRMQQMSYELLKFVPRIRKADVVNLSKNFDKIAFITILPIDDTKLKICNICNRAGQARRSVEILEIWHFVPIFYIIIHKHKIGNFKTKSRLVKIYTMGSVYTGCAKYYSDYADPRKRSVLSDDVVAITLRSRTGRRRGCTGPAHTSRCGQRVNAQRFDISFPKL